VLARAAEPLFKQAREGARGTGGPGLLETLDPFNRSVTDALRCATSSNASARLRCASSRQVPEKVQPRIVSMISDLIAAEVNAGTYEPAVEPETLAYAIVRPARPSSTTTPPRACAVTSIG
jgi:Tetracyclin repressor-like, C-terminal domain